MSYSVNISVEAPIENQIQEINYDGTEIYQPPLTLSESLAKYAQKIDFSKTEIELKKEETDDSKSDTDSKDAFQSSLWPWDSVRNKLRSALQEVCVLADVLAIAKDKRYLILDPVQQEALETKPMVQIYARKKALQGAANVLLAGSEKLKTSQSEAARNRTTLDFHIELLRLRQNWRLKKVSNTIIGDLSYRTAGSKYLQTGTFEVTKAEDEEKPSSPPSSPLPTGPAPVKPNSALRVSIPSELQGVAYIEVLCQKDQEDLCSANINLLGSGPPASNPDMHWQQKLEAAQNVLFCKELFNQLAKEAVQLQAPIPHMVVGNQIMATVLPGIQLIIGLCHSTTGDKKQQNPPPSKTEHDHVLEHSLHQLLREVHHKNTHHPFPHPATGPLGPSKKRMIAGPMAADRYELLEMTKTETLLEQIVKQAQHFIMRMRTEYVLDTIAKEVKDPLISSHWNTLNSPTQSCVKINISTHGYDAVCRTPLVIHIGEKNLKCICRDGKVMNMSYEPQELRDLIMCHINQHQILAVQALAKTMGWQALGNSSHLEIDKKKLVRKKMEPHQCGLSFMPVPVANYFVDSGLCIEFRRKLLLFSMISIKHPLCQVNFKSSSLRRREEARHLANYRMMIHPFSMMHLYWEYLISVVYTLLFFILSMNATTYVGYVNPNRLILKSVLDMILTVDIIKIFFTGYYDNLASKTVLSRSAVAKRYLRRYFFVDVFSSVHGYLALYEVLSGGVRSKKKHDLVVVIIAARILTCCRILRIKRWLHALEMFQMSHRWSSFISKATRAIFIFTIVLLWLYMLIFHVKQYIDRTYLGKLADHAPFYQQYYSATLKLLMVTYGYGELRHVSQIITAIFFMAIGYCMQLFVFAQVMQVWRKFESARSKNYNLYQQFKEYVKYKGLPVSLRNKFFAFFDFKFQNQFYNESHINSMVSAILKQEILLYITKNHISRVDFFKGMPSDLLTKLVVNLKSEIFLAGDVIITAGLAGNCMYFIYYGTVAIYSPSGREICHLEDGAHFGEIALIFKEPRVATVIAVTPCELFVLNRSDFIDVLQPFPDLYDKIMTMAKERLRTSKAVEMS